jgi:YidC/Oxa1 family membrane protein insertase
LDRKTIILIIALGLLVIFWIPIMTRLGLIQPPQKTRPTAPATTGEPARPVERETKPVERASVETTAIEAAVDTMPQLPEDTMVIETNVFAVTLSSYGGAPVSIKLKDYQYNDDGPIEMLPDCETATPEFTFNGGAVNANDFVYQSSLTPGKYKINSGDRVLTYTYNSQAGGKIIKRYRFYANRYDYDLILEVSGRAGFGFEREYSLEWGNKLGATELNIQDDYNSMWAMALMGNEREKFDDYKDDRFDVSLTGDTRWIATRSKYFTAVLVPRSRLSSGVKSSGAKEKVLTSEGSFTARELRIGLLMSIEYEENLVDSFSVFVGPIDYEILKDFNDDVVDLIDIGTTPFVGWIIKIFAIPIIWLLPRMHGLIPNYGLVIIIFSLLIKLITWPLSKKTVKSMMAMRELQPKMEELKKKHKKNPQALNREMMKLYKEKGINPLSGCLPYLPQLPLFFALFSVFRSTILLRQAPFILWWDDLSRGALSVTDPYIILVILMVVLMFVQQKMTMTDPKNKALTYIFPLMLGFFFYKASAGLVLYWTCFSLFSFIEQIVFRKPAAKPAPAE